MTDENKDFVRLHYFFKGRVQGVGFRYTAVVYARRLGLTGWVRNNPDGQVEMKVQGSRLRINLLIDQLAHSVPIRIDHVQEWALPLVPNERSFGEIY